MQSGNLQTNCRQVAPPYPSGPNGPAVVANYTKKDGTASSPRSRSAADLEPGTCPTAYWLLFSAGSLVGLQIFWLSLRRSANFTSVCGDLLELERGGLDDSNASPRGGNPTAALSEGPTEARPGSCFLLGLSSASKFSEPAAQC